MDSFITWFREHGGYLDTNAMELRDIPEQGRGAVALRHIPKGTTLFSIPRPLTLSARTSTLPELVGEKAWKQLQLNKGWVGLILCMMWEEAQGEKSKWSEYLKSLPSTFDTPMFWSENDLKELEGTNVVNKIGKEEAEQDYHDKLVPAVQSRPDLFDASHLASSYSLANYHVMGSRILSRSFRVERDGSGDEADEHETDSNEPAMDVDADNTNNEAGMTAGEEDSQSGDSEDDEEDSSDVSMVPMADMLNARYGSENAKLFYETTELKMVTTKSIAADEQIFNTYGDPPNSDLLRRYGHVDCISLPGGGIGNPGDTAEFSADLIVQIVVEELKKRTDSEEIKERIDWWLEEGGDDVFILSMDDQVPPKAIAAFIKLLYSQAEWDRLQEKGKLSKPKWDETVIPIAIKVIERRLSQYPTSIQDDEMMLSSPGTPLSINKRNAIIVRLGEKRVLQRCIDTLRSAENALRALQEGGSRLEGGKKKEKKRKRGE